MTVKITTFNDKTYEISEDNVRFVNEALARGDKHIRIGELGVILAVSDIRSIDNSLKYVPPETPALSAPKAAEWKWAQWEELSQRWKQHMKKPLEERGPWLAWIDTEDEYWQVMAGEKPWPTKEAQPKPIQTAVLDEVGIVSWKDTGGDYSEQALAQRREFNRNRYQPKRLTPNEKVIRGDVHSPHEASPQAQQNQVPQPADSGGPGFAS